MPLKKVLLSLFLLEAGTEETRSASLLPTDKNLHDFNLNIQQAALDDLQRLFGTNFTPSYFLNQNIHTKICELLLAFDVVIKGVLIDQNQAFD